MKIGKPLMLITTPVGLALGLYEGYHLAGGLIVLLVILVGGFGVAMASLVLTIRRERAAEAAKAQGPPQDP
jgi:hypothetical protein